MDLTELIARSVVRHVLTYVAGLLGSFGLSEALQGQIVDSLLPLVLSAALAGIALVLSYFQKKLALDVAEAALSSSPSTPMSMVFDKVLKK